MTIGQDVLRDRVRGCVVGAAIGDALGHETEFLSMEAIRQRFGTAGVAGFERWGSDPATGRRVALFTDDTQMAECVLRALLAGGAVPERDVVMADMCERFVGWSRAPIGGHRAPGGACMSGCSALAGGADWRTAGGATAGGCGSVMRVYPVGLRFAFAEAHEREWWAVAQSWPTHRDPIATAASAAMAAGVAGFLRGDDDRHVFADMTAAAARHDYKTAGMICRALRAAEDGTNPASVYDKYRGWAAHEAIAAGVFAAARQPSDTAAAMLEAANTPGDSDSLATLAGGLLGARNRLSTLPQDWVRDIERSAEFLALADELTDLIGVSIGI
ncbi:MAG: ADP-ribosylglycohydrolase family protein [Planctomycetota bacterium]